MEEELAFATATWYSLWTDEGPCSLHSFVSLFNEGGYKDEQLYSIAKWLTAEVEMGPLAVLQHVEPQKVIAWIAACSRETDFVTFTVENFLTDSEFSPWVCTKAFDIGAAHEFLDRHPSPAILWLNIEENRFYVSKKLANGKFQDYRVEFDEGGFFGITRPFTGAFTSLDSLMLACIQADASDDESEWDDDDGPKSMLFELGADVLDDKAPFRNSQTTKSSGLSGGFASGLTGGAVQKGGGLQKKSSRSKAASARSPSSSATSDDYKSDDAPVTLSGGAYKARESSARSRGGVAAVAHARSQRGGAPVARSVMPSLLSAQSRPSVPNVPTAPSTPAAPPPAAVPGLPAVQPHVEPAYGTITDVATSTLQSSGTAGQVPVAGFRSLGITAGSWAARMMSAASAAANQLVYGTLSDAKEHDDRDIVGHSRSSPVAHSLRVPAVAPADVPVYGTLRDGKEAEEEEQTHPVAQLQGAGSVGATAIGDASPAVQEVGWAAAHGATRQLGGRARRAVEMIASNNLSDVLNASADSGIRPIARPTTASADAKRTTVAPEKLSQAAPTSSYTGFHDATKDDDIDDDHDKYGPFHVDDGASDSKRDPSFGVHEVFHGDKKYIVFSEGEGKEDAALAKVFAPKAVFPNCDFTLQLALYCRCDADYVKEIVKSAGVDERAVLPSVSLIRNAPVTVFLYLDEGLQLNLKASAALGIAPLRSVVRKISGGIEDACGIHLWHGSDADLAVAHAPRSDGTLYPAAKQVFVWSGRPEIACFPLTCSALAKTNESKTCHFKIIAGTHVKTLSFTIRVTDAPRALVENVKVAVDIDYKAVNFITPPKDLLAEPSRGIPTVTDTLSDVLDVNIAESTHSVIYATVLPDMRVCVKKVARNNIAAQKSLAHEIAVLNVLNGGSHANIVSALGKGDNILLLEYAPLGSVHSAMQNAHDLMPLWNAARSNTIERVRDPSIRAQVRTSCGTANLAAYFDGGASLLKGAQLRSTATKVSLARDAAHGIRYLHSLSMPHNDIATRNQLLLIDAPADAVATGQVSEARFIGKLCDFGLSCWLGVYEGRDKLPQVETLGYGDYRNKAPETWQHRIVSPQTDVYQLGTYLYELSHENGQPPWSTMMAAEIYDALFGKTITPEHLSCGYFGVVTQLTDEMLRTTHPDIVNLIRECCYYRPLDVDAPSLYSDTIITRGAGAMKVEEMASGRPGFAEICHRLDQLYANLVEP